MEIDGEAGEIILGRVDKEIFPENLAFELGINEIMDQAVAF